MKSLSSEPAEIAIIKTAFYSHNHAIETLRLCDEASITEESFFFRNTSAVYSTLLLMRDAGIRIGPDTFLEYVATNECKGISDTFLSKKLEESHQAECVSFYIDRVHEYHMKRKLWEICNETIQDVSSHKDIDEVASNLHTSLCGITNVDPVITSVMAADLIYDRWVNARNGIVSDIPTPFESFNMLTGGAQKKLVSLFCGRSGDGKSCILSQWYHLLGSGMFPSGATVDPVPTVTFCTEDGIERTMARVAGHHRDFNVFKRDRGDSTDGQMLTAREALDEVKMFPVIYEERHRTVQQIRSQLTRLKMDYGIQIAFVDGWKDVRDNHDRWTERRVEEYKSQHICETAGLLDMALVPVHHLIKIDKGVRITEGNIRGSGLITADARTIYALQNTKEKGWEFDSIKANFSPKGTVGLGWINNRGRFVEREPTCEETTEPEQQEDELTLPF